MRSIFSGRQPPDYSLCNGNALYIQKLESRSAIALACSAAKKAVSLRFQFLMASSSRGLGRWPLTPVTRVRIPYSLPVKLKPYNGLGFYFCEPRACQKGNGHIVVVLQSRHGHMAPPSASTCCATWFGSAEKMGSFVVTKTRILRIKLHPIIWTRRPKLIILRGSQKEDPDRQARTQVYCRVQAVGDPGAVARTHNISKNTIGLWLKAGHWGRADRGVQPDCGEYTALLKVQGIQTA